MQRVFILLLVLCFAMGDGVSHAAWIWSPDLGKWINPKKSAKDTPEEQYAWALDFYNKKDWDRAIEEFQKLPEVFPNSRLSAEAMYTMGLCWEEKRDLSKAADAYQKLVDRYPYSDRIKDAMKREFEIADDFASGGKVKLLGVPALPGQQKAVELYKHIVKNAPYGTFGDQAQFKLGELYASQGEYAEAQKAYQAVIDEHPGSDLVPKARYQIAYVSMQASKQAQYNEQYAERALEEFQSFKESFPASSQSVEAEEAIKALRAKKADTQLGVAEFYDRQKKWESAKVYYQEVASKYPETQAAAKANKRLDSLRGKDDSLKSKPKRRIWPF
ncbi:MAG: outer membrane protein assembly factor BamD [Candidatus Omnitrophica bacterium]|nr:outer membrane protein assembly factor BamD [Candidatus Omnitrophota bacterium]